MAKQRYRISKEIKEQIISRIKNDGISVAQAAEDAGVSTATIYTWLGAKATSSVSLLEYNKIRKENDRLKQLLGEITLKLSFDEKRG